MTQRILVVDDDSEIVRLLRAYLEQAGYQVLTAYDGQTALHVLRRDRPDLLLLDTMMPGLDGWQVTRVVRTDEKLAGTPIVMITARVDDEDKIVGLELGADDYVTKPFNPREVLARVRAVLRRTHGDQSPTQILRAGSLTLDVGGHRAEVEGRAVHLTPTEFGLLRALAEVPGHALTRAEMIERGLGYSYEGLDRTVDSHVRNLRRKLEDAGAGGDLIETVFGVGYRFAPGGGA
jgi:two-component system, OmpR family, alkaline phosphatase synthesis response regulator PhoP